MNHDSGIIITINSVRNVIVKGKKGNRVEIREGNYVRGGSFLIQGKTCAGNNPQGSVSLTWFYLLPEGGTDIIRCICVPDPELGIGERVV